MDGWDVLELYGNYSQRFFDAPASYTPDNEHRNEFVSANGSSEYSLRRSGIWYVAMPRGGSTRVQGWKLHISVASDESEAALRACLPVLFDYNVPFKFIVDARTLRRVNGKLWPRGSSGKFAAVYPENDVEFATLGSDLARSLEGFGGPYVLSDQRWPGSSAVFFRYGGFQPQTLLQPDGTITLGISTPDGGLVEDPRTPYWNPPEWLGIGGRPEPTEMRLADGRYLITGALAFSSRGGVYRATEDNGSTSVIIKEARPKVTVGRFGLDAGRLLRKEAEILRQLSASDLYVRVVETFEEDSHQFLVEEFVPGEHLGRYTARNNPIYRSTATKREWSEYFSRVTPLWSQIAEAIDFAHSKDIVLGDISFSNVMVAPDGRVKLIDLESALREDVDPQVGLYSPGMVPPSVRETALMDRSSDQYALGALVLGSVLLTCSFWDLEPSSLWRFVRELQRDVPLPDGLVETVHLLVGDGSQSRGTTTSASQLVGRISSDLSWAPAPHSGDISRPQGLTPAREVDRTLAGLVSYIDGTARLDRTDSLFPADPAVFETNPLSVAYGAAGVVHALHSLGQPINRRYIDWITNRPITNGAYPPGLYLGSAGIAWVLAEVGEGDRACEIMRTARQSPLLWSRPDVMHGAAGYGMACLKMSAMGLGQRFAEEAIEVGEFLVGSAQRNASGHYWPNSNGVAPVGYAYGASGIALFLLYLSAVVSDSSFQDIGRSALGHDLNHAIWLNETLLGFPSEAASDVEVDSLPLVARCYWEAGSAGVLTSVVRYAHMMSDPDLEAWIPHLVADSSHKYAVFPQLFHGLAGLGYALLDVWEFRSDPDALDRARRVAEGVRLFAMERPEGVAFPGEQARRESADYATGAAGVALFLHRLGGADSGDCSNHNFVVDELLPPRRAIKHGSG